MSKKKKIWMTVGLIILFLILAYYVSKAFLEVNCRKYDSGGWGGHCLKGAPSYCKSVYVSGGIHQQSSTRCRFFKLNILPDYLVK